MNITGGTEKISTWQLYYAFNIGINGVTAELRDGSTITMKTWIQEAEAGTFRYENTDNCIILFKIKTYIIGNFFQNKMDKDEYSTLFNVTWKEGSGHYPPNSVTLIMEMKMIRDWIYTF